LNLARTIAKTTYKDNQNLFFILLYISVFAILLNAERHITNTSNSMRSEATSGKIVGATPNIQLGGRNRKKVARRPNRSARNLLFTMAAQDI